MSSSERIQQVSFEIKTQHDQVCISFQVKKELDRKEASGLIDIVDNFFKQERIFHKKDGVKIVVKSKQFEQTMTWDYVPIYTLAFEKSFELMNKIKDYLAAIK